MALTPKQQRFVAEYLLDLNATQAAVRAGYSAKTAHSAGPRLLANVEVARALEEAFKARSERTEITQDRVLRELAKMGFSDIRKAVRWETREATPAEVLEDLEDQPHGGALKRQLRTEVQVVTLVDSDKIDPDTAAAIAEISQTKDGLRLKMHDKLGSLTQVGRHLGMFVDKTEHAGPGGGPIQHEVVDRPPNETREEWIARRNRELGRDVGTAARPPG